MSAKQNTQKSKGFTDEERAAILAQTGRSLIQSSSKTHHFHLSFSQIESFSIQLDYVPVRIHDVELRKTGCGLGAFFHFHRSPLGDCLLNAENLVSRGNC
jgi:hypothetical protein